MATAILSGITTFFESIVNALTGAMGPSSLAACPPVRRMDAIAIVPIMAIVYWKYATSAQEVPGNLA